MNQCELMDELISCEIDGVLDAESRDLLASHLEHCPECRQTRAALLTVREVCAHAELPAPKGLRNAILDGITTNAVCVQLRDILPLAVDNSLDEAQAELVYNHVKSCTTCSNDLAAYCTALSALHASASVEPPADLRERIANATYARRSALVNIAGIWKQWAMPLRSAAVIGGACTIILVAWSLINPQFRHTTTIANVSTSVQVRTVSHAAAGLVTQALTEAKSAQSAPNQVRLPVWRTHRIRPPAIGPLAPKIVMARLPLPPIRSSEPVTVLANTEVLPPETEVSSLVPTSQETSMEEVEQRKPIIVVKVSPEDHLKRQLASEKLVTQMRETINARRRIALSGNTTYPADQQNVAFKLLEARF